MTDEAQGYGKFEETAHELEQAAAEKAGNAARHLRSAGTGGQGSLSAAVRSRPVAILLIACVAGYALGRLANRR